MNDKMLKNSTYTKPTELQLSTLNKRISTAQVKMDLQQQFLRPVRS